MTTVRPITKWILAAIALVGLLLRLAFVTNGGFHNDVVSFISWADTAATYPFSEFYAKAGFADYPPGYLYILAVLGHVAAIFHIGDATVLVKLPAILCDLLIGVLLFNLTRRFVSQNWALGIAAFYLLNPVTILISGLWGQVESVGGSLTLLSMYLLVRAQDDIAPPRWLIPAAWLCLSASILMKPESAVLVAVLVAFAFVDPQRRRERITSTLIGAGASLLLALIVALPFHPNADVFAWLFERYAFGASVYHVSSVNAFNLWSVTMAFWQDDKRPIFIFGIATAPMYVWGMALQLAAVALVIWRYVQEKTSRALLESAALLLLAFFLLNTRMHERYLYDGFLFVIVCAAFAWRYRIAAIVLTVTFFANLQYSLYYLRAYDQHLQVNGMDLWGLPDHALSLINVVTFFVLGYAFLGTDPVPVSQASGTAQATPQKVPLESRSWFDPTEGLSSFKPLDYAVSAVLGVASFVLSFVNYWLPNEKVFDEVYFARAGEEYLKHLPIYETTHPPLTKLLIAGSMLLFGGLHGLGDTPWGWRFVDVVCGALVVMLLYAFARRVTGSTIFAAIAASLLMFDGMHFVQSRIATPEGIVIVFSLAAVYAFYRFWIASQINVRQRDDKNGTLGAVAAATISLAVGFIGSAAIDGWRFHQSTASVVVIGFYASVGLYLLARLLLPILMSTGARELSYPEGSYAIIDGGSTAVYTADGGELDPSGKATRRGRRSQSRNNALVYKDEELEIAYARDASVTYKTPVGSALYTSDGIVTDVGSERRGSATFWLLAFTVALGCLVASKWYGVMSFGVSTYAVVLIWVQRFRTRPFGVSNGLRWDLVTYGAIAVAAAIVGSIVNTFGMWFDVIAVALLLVATLAWLQGFTGFAPRVWGNPRGFRLDVALCTIVFVASTVYGLVYIPDLVRQVDIRTPTELVYHQYAMFHYHDTLVATHPYASQWWEWPLDLRPVAYYYHDGRTDKSDPNAGPVSEIISLPNPAILWFGLLTVPFVGVLAWLRRNKGYALIVLTYLMQWLPWMKSPRIAFAYHFYVDIPLICLCSAIALQWAWNQFKDRGPEARWITIAGIGLYVAIVAATFVWFYPILAGTGLPWNAWDARMWHNFMGSDWV